MAKTKSKPTPPAVDGVATADEWLDELWRQFKPKLAPGQSQYGLKLDSVPAGKYILGLDRDVQAAAVARALDRLDVLEPKVTAFRAKLTGNRAYNPHAEPGWDALWNPRWTWAEALRGLLRRQLPLPEGDVIRLVRWPAAAPDGVFRLSYLYPLAGVAGAVEHFAESSEPGQELRAAVEALVAKLRADGASDTDNRKTADRLQAVLAGGPEVHIESGEAWADAARADLAAMKAKPRAAWNALLAHCRAGGGAKLTAAWAAAAKPLVEAVGFDGFKDHVLHWFALVDRPRTAPHVPRYQWEPDQTHLIQPPHVELLRGLARAAALREDADLARALGRLALSAYRKVPGKGPRLVSLGNAAVTALGAMPGRAPVGQLALLQVKVKFGTARKEIEKAFAAAAQREGLPREEIEELAVPSYGLDPVGVLRQEFGEYVAELRVDGSSAALHWSKDGKPLKAVPAAVKQAHGDELKELQATVKDVNAMLPAQRERIDSLFLARKPWPVAVWRERYLDHPLVGTIARRLIWTVTGKGKPLDVTWADGELVGVNGKPATVADDAAVTLWHPIGRPTGEVLAWREFLEQRQVVQPFKQAHREVYVLTEAERRTGTYSNRFAAHVLKQHQFHALCAARGWKNRLRLMVDDSYPPAHRELPEWGLRAEYWVEGIGDGYGTDTTESGAYLYLATDQVRFYRLGAPQLYAHAGGGGYGRYGGAGEDPLPLAEVPPLVFSEVMRDVDLFVGVASVANDPNWADGGPGGRHRDYWHDRSFGELSATAGTRKAILERLVPRLKIADRCSFTDRFLVVRGDLRTYQIHLGSGNILMRPNDQYLCIVPKQSVAGADPVFLPFEGDGTLSTILSKAFLLAADTKITDPTIVSQLRR